MEKYAIIDLGSNTVRLVIFEVYANGSYKMVESLSDTIRLSHGMGNANRLSLESMQRARDTIKVFSLFCKNNQVPKKNIFAFATAATRLAVNGQEFIQNLNSLYGITFRILSGGEESLYVFNAVNKTFDHRNGIIVDIGGGSTEIIRFENGKVLGHISIPYGCVSVTEEYSGNEVPPSQKKTDLLVEELKKELSKLDWFTSAKTSDLIGIGGTIRTMAKIHMQERNYTFNRINNYIVPISDFYLLYKKILSSNTKELKMIKGLSSDRIDVICGGLTIFNTICSLIKPEKIIISGSGLREGVFFEHMFSQNKLIPFKNALDFSLENFILLYNIRVAHANHVSTLALKLFDLLKPIHGSADENLRFLKTASLIHGAGIYISYYNFSKHSLYLILNSDINGLTHCEQILVAIAASGLSDKKLGRSFISSYSNILSKDNYTLAKMFALIIQIAEALDKSETKSIIDIDCEISKSRVRLITKKSTDATIEIKSTREYEADFKKLFKKSLEVI